MKNKKTPFAPRCSVRQFPLSWNLLTRRDSSKIHNLRLAPYALALFFLVVGAGQSFGAGICHHWFTNITFQGVTYPAYSVRACTDLLSNGKTYNWHYRFDLPDGDTNYLAATNFACFCPPPPGYDAPAGIDIFPTPPDGIFVYLTVTGENEPIPAISSKKNTRSGSISFVYDGKPKVFQINLGKPAPKSATISLPGNGGPGVGFPPMPVDMQAGLGHKLNFLGAGITNYPWNIQWEDALAEVLARTNRANSSQALKSAITELDSLIKAHKALLANPKVTNAFGVIEDTGAGLKITPRQDIRWLGFLQGHERARPIHEVTIADGIMHTNRTHTNLVGQRWEIGIKPDGTLTARPR